MDLAVQETPVRPVVIGHELLREILGELLPVEVLDGGLQPRHNRTVLPREDRTVRLDHQMGAQYGVADEIHGEDGVVRAEPPLDQRIDAGFHAPGEVVVRPRDHQERLREPGVAVHQTPQPLGLVPQQFPPIAFGDGEPVLPGQAFQTATQQVVPRRDGAVQRRGADPQAFGHPCEGEVPDPDLKCGRDDVVVGEARFRAGAPPV